MDKRFLIFRKGISLEVNIIAQLEFELASFVTGVKPFFTITPRRLNS